MFTKRWSAIRYVALAVGLTLGAGCGESGGDERPDPEMIGGKADVPSWMTEVKVDWGCGDVVQGEFQGRKSSFLYKWEAKEGQTVTFSFRGAYDARRGAAVALYRADTGDRVAVQRNGGRNEAQLTYGPAKAGTYNVAVYALAWIADGAYSLRATCQRSDLNALVRGQRSFTSYELEWGLNRMAPGMEGKGGGGGPEAAMAAPQGRSGEVEEADVYKLDGNRLFYLNTYRGFMIFDATDAKKPQALGRLPVYGYPVEMFVQNNVAYALLRDVLYLTQQKGQLRYQRRNVSQLVAIDVSDLRNPKLLQAVDIVGELREGVSRKIGDTIYVVSNVPSWYAYGWWYEQSQESKEQGFVYSFNVANPRQVKLVDKLQLFSGGGYSNYGEQGGESRYLSNVTLSATSNALMVVENWQKYGYVPGAEYSCGTSTSLQQAVVSVVDISDPAGKIKLYTKFESYGEVGDQFKQTYVFNPTTKKATYLGIFARREWSSKDCQGTSRIENNLESWDVTNGAAPKRLARLSFGKPDEAVRGSAFDAERGVAFAITARQVDPLYAISFADPAKLKVVSAVDGLSGDMNVFRFIADKRFLIGIGRDNSEACTGFGPQGTGTQLGVSIIDVQDLAKVRLVQRKCVMIKDATWVSSAINWNLDQAHKMIGMHSDGLANVITVPVSYSRKMEGGEWYYRWETAVGLMSWDLTKYDPKKSELEQNVLVNHGTVVHPNGEVNRTIVFTHKAATARRKLLNLSDTHLALTDINDLNSPVTDAVIEVAPYYAELYRFGNYMVTQVRPGVGGWDDGGLSEFRVLPVGAKLDTVKPVATFTVSRVQRTMQFKDALVIFRRKPAMEDPEGKRPYQGNETLEAVVYQLSNPLKPVKMGSVEFPFSYLPYERFRCGMPPFWFGYEANATLALDRGFVMLNTQYDYNKEVWVRTLMLLDLSSYAAPKVVSRSLGGDEKTQYLGLVRWASNKNYFYLTYKSQVDEKPYQGGTQDGMVLRGYKYVAQTWLTSTNGLTPDAKINLPGQLMQAFSGPNNTLFLTNDRALEELKDGSLRDVPRLNLLSRLDAYTAEYLDGRSFPGKYLQDVVLDGKRLFVNASEGWYQPVVLEGKTATPIQAAGQQLAIFDFSRERFDERFSGSLGIDSMEIMGIYQNNLFLNLPGSGVLVVDVTSSTRPVGRQFLRTLGYATQAEFVGNTAFVASGNYGIYELNLTGPTLIAAQ